MHAFNHKGVVTKYTSLNAILKEFAEVRLALYETRRQHQMKTLKDVLPYHEDIVRFIQDQIADSPTIELRKKTRVECDRILTDAKYTHIDDIMKLPVSAFTAEQVDKHMKKLADLRDSIATLEKTCAADLWLEDLRSYKQ